MFRPYGQCLNMKRLVATRELLQMDMSVVDVVGVGATTSVEMSLLRSLLY